MTNSFVPIMKSTQQNEKGILKQIEQGDFKNCYLVYNRKSTDDLNNQKNSIKYQKSENSRFAYKEHLKIASTTLNGFCEDGIICELHSGFKEDIELIFTKGENVQYRIERPKFYQLVQFLSKRYFKGVIFLCWDRASRNKGDDTVIRKLMKNGVDIRFALATYDKTSSGALHMDIDGMFAEHHSRVTSEKVSLTIRNKREMGICTYKAPVGYLNLGSMENKPVDPIRGPIIKRLYELYATGDWSLADLARVAIDQGFTMNPTKRRRTKEELLSYEDEDEDGTNTIARIEAIARPPTFNNIHKILTNRFYIGEIIGNDQKYLRSKSHQPLISETLFYRVQAILNKNSVSVHYTNKLHQPFRGIVRCNDCKRVYTPYIQKNIVYYSSRCKEQCSNTNRNINVIYLTDKIGELIQRLSFTEQEKDEISARTLTDIAILENKRNAEIEQSERKKRRVREDLAYLRSNKLSLLKAGAYSVEAIVEEEEKLNKDLIKLQEQEQISDKSMHEMILDVIKLSELLKNVYLHYQSANSFEKEAIVKIIFSELSFFDNTLNYKCKNGFQVLENRFIPVCDQTTWISELQKYHTPIKQSITELEAIHNV